MAVTREKKLNPKPKYKVGDTVSFQLGRYPIHGVITEDRGCIGARGRRLYQITFDFADETKVTELGEEEFQRDVVATSQA